MGIEIMRSVGVLVTAFKGGYLSTSEAEEAFQKIRNAKRYISEQLINDALEIIHGSK
jgi:predicted nucleic acid-binding protein